ncbi:dihydroneopterin aldolase [Shouchella lonarensis]|uniref:7,8-dihydroneopterin aldolase n=1 Tax=Shouchella lonarensis TaxID=1464122 RepID=A0A1G6NWA2_9BACI|nr:dihydroneopterin aldolase [Shouchella lonarensis]SDC71445.1 dihydroneopterin aldolase [Shouchella lonarensis]
MDKIHMKQLSFYGYHGVFPEERKLGQRFMVDVTLMLDLSAAALNDELTASIDYGDVYARIRDIVEGKPHQLVEALTNTIMEELFAAYERLQACTVVVTKPDPPIPGHYQSVAVEMTRQRDDT